MGGFVVDRRSSSSNAPRFEEILAAFDDDISEVTIQTEVGHCTAKQLIVYHGHQELDLK